MEIALKEAIMGGYTTGAVTQALMQYAQSHEFSENDLAKCMGGVQKSKTNVFFPLGRNFLCEIL